MDKIVNGGLCPITGWKISEAVRQGYNWIYRVTCGHFSFKIGVSEECLDNPIINGQKHIIRWLLVNGKINTIQSQTGFLSPVNYLITSQIILDTIAETFIPNTPKEKSEQFLVLLNKVFPSFSGEITEDDLFNLSFFQKKFEFKIYLNFLKDSDFIKLSTSFKIVNITPEKGKSITMFIIEFKFEGINYLASLEENGRNSKNCFIAMSFSDDTKIIAIKEAIKSAVEKTKYNVVIINEKNIESDRTINDAIIAEIKRARFVIADFTDQKRGVYFEAGYALGLGIPVIYCCNKTDFDNSHFDVNHYPHILYSTPEELEKQIIDKIRAWID